MCNFKKFFALVFIVSLLMCCSVAFANGEWNCPECGLLNSGNFCTQCGTKRPEEIICPNCGEKYSLDSDVRFCGKCGTKLQQENSQKKYEGNGFDSPEDAVKCYLEGLKNLDFEKMLSAFAWETQAKNYSAKKHLERIRSYFPSAPARIPSVNDFMLSANLHSIRNREINSIYFAIEAYCLDYSELGMPVQLKTDGEIEEFLKKFSKEKIERLSKLSNIKFLSPAALAPRWADKRNQQNLEREKIRYGADELVNVPVFAGLEEDEVLFCCPTVVRYGKKWYIASVSSNLNLFLNIDSFSQAFHCEKGNLNDIK